MTISAMIRIAPENMGSLLTALANVEHDGLSILPENGQTAIAASEATEPISEAVPGTRKRATAGTVLPSPRRTSSRAGRVVLYTPAGTKAAIAKQLAALKDNDSISAFVYRDLAKHPKSLNADVRKRAKAAKLNPESVDNAIWMLTKKGLVSKEAKS